MRGESPVEVRLCWRTASKGGPYKPKRKSQNPRGRRKAAPTADSQKQETSQERRRWTARRWAAQLAKDLKLRRYFQESWKNFLASRWPASFPRKVSKRH